MLSKFLKYFYLLYFITDIYLMLESLSFSSFENISCTLLFIRDDSIAEGMEVLHILLDLLVLTEGLGLIQLLLEYSVWIMMVVQQVFFILSQFVKCGCLLFPFLSYRYVCRVQFSNIYGI